MIQRGARKRTCEVERCLLFVGCEVVSRTLFQQQPGPGLVVKQNGPVKSCVLVPVGDVHIQVCLGEEKEKDLWAKEKGQQEGMRRGGEDRGGEGRERGDLRDSGRRR